MAFGRSGTETDHTWKQGAAAAPDLGAVSVFDALAAQVCVSDKTEARFKPFATVWPQEMLDNLLLYACA